MAPTAATNRSMSAALGPTYMYIVSDMNMHYVSREAGVWPNTSNSTTSNVQTESEPNSKQTTNVVLFMWIYDLIMFVQLCTLAKIYDAFDVILYFVNPTF